jgi:hypothetical protein
LKVYELNDPDSENDKHELEILNCICSLLSLFHGF